MDEDDDWDLDKAMARYGSPTNFHGAAIIDAEGREIEITEEMIQGACDCLIEAWHFPSNCEEAQVLMEVVIDDALEIVIIEADTQTEPDLLQPET